MATFSVRIPDDLAARFDRAAAPVGGRSPMLRRLIRAAVISEATSSNVAPRMKVTSCAAQARVMVRLTAAEATAVDAAAAAMELRRATWIAALVRRRVLGRPTFGRSEALQLALIRGEIRRIGVNVNQIARAVAMAQTERRLGCDNELASLEVMRRELSAQVVALGDGFQGNLDYWNVT
jgi:metal-responsive CopG/Arc/MetJ family transcriptional regulator